MISGCVVFLDAKGSGDQVDLGLIGRRPVGAAGFYYNPPRRFRMSLTADL
jgi:hypothetical protein